MASVKRRETTRGGPRYDVRYRTPGGQVRTKTFRIRKDADRFSNTVEADKLRGAWIDPSSSRLAFREYAGEWQASRVHRPSTAIQVESYLQRQILPAFGDKPIGGIRTTDVQAFVKRLTDHYTAGTVEVIYRYLASIFRSAVRDRLIAASPCIDIALPKLERKRVIPLETEQVHALAAAMPQRYRALVMTAAGTGLRQGEAFGLTLEHVDFLARRLEVTQQLLTLPKMPPHFAPPKTEASRRSIPLPQIVIDEIAAHLARQPAGESGLIFTNEAEEPISRTRFSDVWRPAVKAAGAPKGTGFHALRHYYASLLIRHGESVKVVQARLGHASAAETLDTYSHLWPDSEDQTRTAVNSILGGEWPRVVGANRSEAVDL